MQTISLAQLLHDATRVLRKRFEERSAALGLTSAQWRMLVLVCKHDGAPQSRFADLLEVEPITASRLLDRMEKLAWVRRESDPNDRRARLVRPTEKALTAFGSVKEIAEDVYVEALAGLNPSERDTLNKALSTIITNLSQAGLASTEAPT
jgi:DNA-binding MarR family transcriptional regulator